MNHLLIEKMIEKPMSSKIGNNSLINKLIVNPANVQIAISRSAIIHLGILILLLSLRGGMILSGLSIWFEGFF